ncbi:hypothetical protein JOQ06_028260 [Pogonophryne albipinna]|uniref:Uncharacterized protein n=1 Tax=Pogonophryne albipinna TaxID=1090488 RepID=A0AAD6B7M8_9TELE|nr:hypothetical protein JOQ06_028260 [Pogonophryne albipinna]
MPFKAKSTNNSSAPSQRPAPHAASSPLFAAELRGPLSPRFQGGDARFTPLQAKVEHLSAELERVDNKCEDLEARSRRNNVRIVGVPEETTITNTTATISTLLKEAFKLEKEPLLDRAHRTLQPKPRPGERPRTIQ